MSPEQKNRGNILFDTGKKNSPTGLTTLGLRSYIDDI